MSDDESELLQEYARLASRRTGGCLYYSLPGGEEGFQTRTGKGKGGGGGGSGIEQRGARPFFETISGIVLEGVAGVSGEGGGYDVEEEDEEGDEEEDEEKFSNNREAAAAVVEAAASTGLKETMEEEEDEEETECKGDMKDKHGRVSTASPPRGRNQRKATDGRDGEVQGESSEVEDDGRARKRRRRRQREEEVKEGAPNGGDGGSRSNDRRGTDREVKRFITVVSSC